MLLISPIVPPLSCPFFPDYATSKVNCAAIMLHYAFMPPHKKRTYAPLCAEICSNMLRRDQGDVSARQCTPRAECSTCIGLSLYHCVADYQSPATAVVIAAG